MPPVLTIEDMTYLRRIALDQAVKLAVENGDGSDTALRNAAKFADFIIENKREDQDDPKASFTPPSDSPVSR